MIRRTLRAAQRALLPFFVAFALTGSASATPTDPFQSILDFLVGVGADPGLDPNGDGLVDVADLVWLLNDPGTAEAAGVVLTLCEDSVPVGRGATIFVDVVDAQGRIINPGTPGGLPEGEIVLVTLNASGSGLFDGLFNFTLVPVSEPGGGEARLLSLNPETVDVTATADPLPAPSPVSVTFVPSGSISGTMLVNDGSPRPPLMGESFTIIAEEQGGDFGGLGTFTDDQGHYTIAGLGPGTYSVSYGPLLDGSSQFQGECVRDVVVTAGSDTIVDVTLQPWAGSGTVSGSFAAESGEPLQNGTVILFPSGVDPCARLAGARGTFALPDSYLLQVVPAGTYDVQAQATDAATGMRFFSNGFADEVTVGSGQSVDFPLVLTESLPLANPSPVDYARVSGNPTFRWTDPPGVTDASYGIELRERCDTVTSAPPIWMVTDITGTERVYDGPPLEPNKIYEWAIIGTAQGGRQFLFPPTDVEFRFIAE